MLMNICCLLCAVMYERNSPDGSMIAVGMGGSVGKLYILTYTNVQCVVDLLALSVKLQAAT
jgi:hypothetical protein